MELNFEANDYNYYKDEEGNLIFEDGPYRSVKIINNSNNEENDVIVGKRHLTGNNTIINPGGAGKGKRIIDGVDVSDVEVSFDGNSCQYAKQNVDNANGDREIIIKDLEPIDSEDEGYFKIEAGENELFDRIFLNFKSGGSEFIGGGTMNPVDSGNNQGSSQDDNGSGNDNVDLSLYTENSKIEDVGDAGYVNYRDVDKSDQGIFGNVATYSIYPSGENVAMKRADVKLCMNIENNLRKTVTTNGEFEIDVPSGKDFITHGVIDVQVPSNVNVANNLGFQVSGNFSPESGAGNMMVSSHTLNLSNGYPNGSNYDAMESADVSVKLNKKVVEETYDRNGTFTIDGCNGNEFFNGGTITVSVPEKEIAENLGFQVSGNFSPESGAGNMMVSSHILNLSNGYPNGSNYDGMESANVYVKLNKKVVDETYDRNGTFTIDGCNGNEFFNGGTITVSVPEKEIAENLSFQVTGNFSPESGVGNMMVSSHTLNLTNGYPNGSNYDGMKRAVVNIKLNKYEYSRSTITSNGTYTIPECPVDSYFTGGRFTVNVDNKPEIIGFEFGENVNGDDGIFWLSRTNQIDFHNSGGNKYCQITQNAGKTVIAIYNVSGNDHLYNIVVYNVKTSKSGPLPQAFGNNDSNDCNKLLTVVLDRNISYLKLLGSNYSNPNDDKPVIMELVPEIKSEYDIYKAIINTKNIKIQNI